MNSTLNQNKIARDEPYIKLYEVDSCLKFYVKKQHNVPLFIMILDVYFTVDTIW